MDTLFDILIPVSLGAVLIARAELGRLRDAFDSARVG